ncbi:MAG: DUF5688 family protein [Lachnospiraceae bacterium]
MVKENKIKEDVLCEDFFALVKECVAKYMGEDYNVTLNKVEKNNGLELTGLVIMEKGRSAAPTIYLEDYYCDYVEGKSIGEIVERIVMVYEEHRDKLNVDFSFFSDYDKVKPHIMYKLLNYEANRKLLEDLPHKNYMDLAVVFYVMIDNDVIGNGSVLIHNNHARMWQVNENDLYDTALQNTPQQLQYCFSSMENVLEEMIGVRESDDLLDSEEISPNDIYILTNRRKLFGASCLLYDGLIKKISEKLQSSLYIIPSSIHELIIIPQKTFPRERESLIDLVRNINATEVDVTDMLSNTVYEYRRDQDDLIF